MSEWYYEEHGNRIGPKTEEEMRRLVEAGSVPRTALCWTAEFGSDWKPISATNLVQLESGPPPLPREATSRENKRLARRLRQARLRQSAVVEDVDFRAHRGLDRALFLKLADCEWIGEHHHLCLIGPTGVGKSWLACALGHKACREGFSVLYKRASRLFTDLAQARGEGRLLRLMTTLERTRLLIIDDWGPEPLNTEQRRDLLEIVR